MLFFTSQREWRWDNLPSTSSKPSSSDTGPWKKKKKQKNLRILKGNTLEY